MDVNNNNFNKEGILEILKDNIVICNEHTTNILCAKYILDAYGVKSEVKQCWKINGHKVNYGINEGYSVNLVSCESDELRELYETISIPHITLSISPEGKAVNTKNLDFEPTDEFIVLTKFGGFLGKPIYKN